MASLSNAHGCGSMSQIVPQRETQQYLVEIKWLTQYYPSYRGVFFQILLVFVPGLLDIWRLRSQIVPLTPVFIVKVRLTNAAQDRR
jgi:hypothetical protein